MERGDRNRQGGMQGINLTEIVNSAVQEGIDAIIDQHPRFSGQEELLLSYVDRKKINRKLNDYLSQQHENNSLNVNNLVDEIANYIISGDSFKERGKEIILRKGLEEKSKKWWNFSAKEIFKGEKYLDETMNSFRDLYQLFKSGDYAQRMPELYKAVSSVYDMGFADAAVNILYENGLMNEGRYNVVKKVINERVKQGVEYTKKSLTDYVMPQKTAAVILGVIGLASLLANNSITGNVIGVSKPNIFGLLGGLVLLIFAIWLFIIGKKSKKKALRKIGNKKIKSKKRKKKRKKR